jgi:hypothetical protein
MASESDLVEDDVTSGVAAGKNAAAPGLGPARDRLDLSSADATTLSNRTKHIG